MFSDKLMRTCFLTNWYGYVLWQTFLSHAVLFRFFLEISVLICTNLPLYMSWLFWISPIFDRNTLWNQLYWGTSLQKYNQIVKFSLIFFFFFFCKYFIRGCYNVILLFGKRVKTETPTFTNHCCKKQKYETDDRAMHDEKFREVVTTCSSSSSSNFVLQMIRISYSLNSKDIYVIPEIRVQWACHTNS